MRDFVDHFAALIAETGLSRMASRVLVCLLVADAGVLTASELVQRMQVSPAAVSKAVGYLEALDLVRRERVPGSRRECYIFDENAWTRAWAASAQKQTAWAEAAKAGSRILGTDTPAGIRMERVSGFFERLAGDMSRIVVEPETEDALTVLAALVHRTSWRSPDELAAALGWPIERVDAALREAPSSRLTPAQREALGRT